MKKMSMLFVSVMLASTANAVNAYWPDPNSQNLTIIPSNGESYKDLNETVRRINYQDSRRNTDGTISYISPFVTLGSADSIHGVLKHVSLGDDRLTDSSATGFCASLRLELADYTVGKTTENELAILTSEGSLKRIVSPSVLKGNRAIKMITCE